MFIQTIYVNSIYANASLEDMKWLDSMLWQVCFTLAIIFILYMIHDVYKKRKEALDSINSLEKLIAMSQEERIQFLNETEEADKDQRSVEEKHIETKNMYKSTVLVLDLFQKYLYAQRTLNGSK